MSASVLARARVLVVDDHPLFREGLAQFIRRQCDLVCCGEADSAATTLQAVQEHQPDLVLLDLRLGHEGGLGLIKILRLKFPNVRILIISQQDEALHAERCLRAGAHGYVMKEEATDQILTAIRMVLTGELYVSRRISLVVLQRFLQRKPETDDPGVGQLSNRELQIFQMLGAGLSTPQISTHLGLSPKTVESHRENIKQKLRLPGSPELVGYATQWARTRTHPPAPSPRGSSGA
jgi:DNA-binding NarL/FixJ family response regulator